MDPPETAPAKVGRRWKTWHLVVASVVALFIGFGLGSAGGPTTTQERPPAESAQEETPAEEQPPPREEAMLQNFEGSGNHSTRPFTVPDKWEVRWNFTGTGHNSLVINAADGRPVDLAHNDIGPGNGVKFYPRGGEFFLEINASGPWTVEVWQVA
jgi:hypothetical protein